MGTVLNAANEVVVHAFLGNKIRFLGIQETIKKMMERHKTIKNPNLVQIIDTDKKTRLETKRLIEKISEK